MKKLIFILTTLLAFALVGCNNNKYEYVEGKVNIVATTTMLGDLAKEIGGDYVSVKTLMGVGVDPHNYEARPSDSRALTKSDLVVVSGLHLEAKMGEILEKLPNEKVIVVGNSLEASKLLKDEDGAIDPHFWFDINLWKVAANALGNKLIAVDSENKIAYETRLNTYLNELDVLDAYVRSKVSELSEDKRKLVTAHDAFQYFAHAYGFEVHAIQGISTQSEASTKDIQDLAKLVKELNVKAVFIESSVPEATIRSVIEGAKALGHTVTIGGELYSDSLGDSASGTETYIKTIRANIDTIVNALK
ncbi:metal ABC transporter solute-binding protein, Zn/Mn family [Haploplasma axanthum]|uniref:Tromp-1 n=1 Tax=Haploplasma axanthum TaxID=29552 RepID=A0A449BBE6_HAPAX|nr:zinc ABC transporter substrate-binding protein [Haploplasma axanthum]VEU79701.1 Tromp-1 [Haploplasma axanthum]